MLSREVKSAKRINYYQTILFAVVFSLCTFPFILLTASAFTKPRLVEVPHLGYWGYGGSSERYREDAPNLTPATVGDLSDDVTTIGAGRVHGSGPNTFEFKVNGKSLSVTVEGSWVEMQCDEGLICE